MISLISYLEEIDSLKIKKYGLKIFLEEILEYIMKITFVNIHFKNSNILDDYFLDYKIIYLNMENKITIFKIII